MGKEGPETIQYIAAGFKMLAGKACMEPHNKEAGIMYKNMCGEYGLETLKKKSLNNNQLLVADSLLTSSCCCHKKEHVPPT